MDRALASNAKALRLTAPHQRQLERLQRIDAQRRRKFDALRPALEKTLKARRILAENRAHMQQAAKVLRQADKVLRIATLTARRACEGRQHTPQRRGARARGGGRSPSRSRPGRPARAGPSGESEPARRGARVGSTSRTSRAGALQ